MSIISGSEQSCKDFCIYDSGCVCDLCERFTNTEYYKIKNQEYDLPEILAGILLSDNDLANLTADDFFDFVGLPQNDEENDIYYRTDFFFFTIVTQAEVLMANCN